MSVAALLIPLTAIVGWFGVLTLIIVFWFILRLRERKTRTLTDDEERMLRELWRGLQKMETRMGNIETILLETKGPYSEGTFPGGSVSSSSPQSTYPGSARRQD